MCGFFPCIPILGFFIFDQKVFWEWRFKFVCETNPLGSCKTQYSQGSIWMSNVYLIFANEFQKFPLLVSALGNEPWEESFSEN